VAVTFRPLGTQLMPKVLTLIIISLRGLDWNIRLQWEVLLVLYTRSSALGFVIIILFSLHSFSGREVLLPLITREQGKWGSKDFGNAAQSHQAY
jgi:hypothetical protein